MLKQYQSLPHGIRNRIKVIAVLTVILLIGIGLTHHSLSAHSAEQASQSISPAARARNVRQEQKRTRLRLQRYLNQVTADKTASVYFYNLGAKSGSPAAKSSSADFYKAGSLHASANAHTPEISASTYKLFMAAFVFHEEKLGNFTWTASNVDGFHRMIVNSDNDFSEDYLDSWGLPTLNQFIAQQGWYNPTFIAGQNSQTTAASLAGALYDLQTGRGAFSNAKDRKLLLNLMHQQIYRTGIPTGVQNAKSGTQVRDKVGFYADTNNDAGIVTLPNGQQYILVVMTHGHQQSGFSGFPRIATIAEHVQRLVYGSSTTKRINALYR